MSFIKFAVKSVRTDKNKRILRANIINKVDSTVDAPSTHDMVHIIAALSASLAMEQNNQFTYTFPFNLS